MIIIMIKRSKIIKMLFKVLTKFLVMSRTKMLFISFPCYDKIHVHFHVA